VTSAGGVFPRSASPAGRGDFIQGLRAISFGIVDPALKRFECPASSAPAQMHRCGKSLRRDPAVQRRATQRGHSKYIPKAKERRRNRRSFATPGMLTRGVAQLPVSCFDYHSTHPVATPERRLRKRLSRAHFGARASHVTASAEPFVDVGSKPPD